MALSLLHNANSKPTQKEKVAARNPLERLPINEVERQLSTGSNGLSATEARARLEKYGVNALPETTVNPLLQFLGYFWGPIPWMIEAATLLSAAVQHWADFAIILVLLVANAVVGFWEEHQAGNAIAALKAKLAVKARVRRDGQWTDIPGRDLVPGDVVRVRLGDVVPADARILADTPVEVDQSALTGESLPVSASGGAALYSGSIIRQGEADALVYATGAGTYFGTTAQLVEAAHVVSHFQKAVLRIGNALIVAAIVMVIPIILVAVWRGDSLLTTLQFALVLTVASIPAAMPTVLSVTMAAGARVLAVKQAIVTRLAAIEEVAGMDVLCTDKTGTLTQNSLTLGEPVAIGHASANDVLTTAALASRAEDHDPIDDAVLAGIKDKAAIADYTVTAFQPFDPVHKRTEATVRAADGTVWIVAKGAPQVVLALIDNAASVKAAVDAATAGFAKRGFRSLGVARRKADEPWQMLGVLPLFDPPRVDSKETIAAAEALGIDVKMVTGDQTAIALEIASELGLGTNIADAADFDDPKYASAEALGARIEAADGFAQVFPEHKFHIVHALQQRGHIVGMTGDGVNDAPPLKEADCGIAVSGATDAARAAADIVLLSAGLSVIIDAIKESRKIFRRMMSYSIYRVAETIRVLLLMTISILVFNFYPVTAVMIVLLALLNDGAILSIAYDNARFSDRPERWDMGQLFSVAGVLGAVGLVASFGLFWLGERVFHLDRGTIQSLIYLKLSIAGHLTIFVTRTRGPLWSVRPANILLAAVFGTQVLATLIAVYGILMAPLGWSWALFVWGYALVWALINDRVKLLVYGWLDKRRAKAPMASARTKTGTAAVHGVG